MRFKQGVDAAGVHPRLWQFLVWLDQVHLEWTEEPMWVTSLRRPYDEHVNTRHAAPPIPLAIGDPRTSPDPYVTAADIRRWALDEMHALGDAVHFCRHIQAMYGSQIGVVLEPEWLSVSQLRRRYPQIFQIWPQPIAIEKASKLVAPHIHVQLKKPIRWTTLA